MCRLPRWPGIFTGAVLKGYGGLHLTLQAYFELLKIRCEGSPLRLPPTDDYVIPCPGASVTQRQTRAFLPCTPPNPSTQQWRIPAGRKRRSSLPGWRNCAMDR